MVDVVIQETFWERCFFAFSRWAFSLFGSSCSLSLPPPSPPPQADEIYLSSPRQGPGSLQTLKRWGKLPNATGILFPKGRDGLEINLESVSLPEGRGPKLRVYI